MIAKMTYDVAAPFITVCVQLLPVLWLAIAVESSWLRRASQSPSRASRLVLGNTTSAIFGVGAVGIAVGLLCLWLQLQSQLLLTVATLALLVASVASALIAGFALLLFVRSLDG